MSQIDSTSFGQIVIGGKTYRHDVIITSAGKLKEGRTAVRHVVGRDEFFQLVFERPDVVLIGTGQYGALRVAGEVTRWAKKAGVELIALPTPQAIERFNELSQAGKRVAAYLHVTC
jgi:hypothetical protein